MVNNIAGLKIKILGDPHLGRLFHYGVPLHRRGERETLIWKSFINSLLDEFDIHITMGDLFDKIIVPLGTILKTAEIYRKAAKAHRSSKFYILQGNHDVSKDSEKKSAFDVFEALMKDIENVVVVRTPQLVEGCLGLFPYDPFISAKEAATSHKFEGCKAVFGHWDTQSYGRQEHNLFPGELFVSYGIEVAYTGHEHLPTIITNPKWPFDLHVVGSMQPYAHGEDPTGDLYITLPLDQVRERLKQDDQAFKYKCLRVDLKSGQKMDLIIECLQLSVRNVDQDGTLKELEPVSLGNFDLEKLFLEVFMKYNLGSKIQDILLEKFNDMRL